MKNKINSILVIVILAVISMACSASFSTANLSDIKLGKDKTASAPSTTFNSSDEIFAVTAINNASGKNKVKFRMTFDKVEGAQSGAVAYGMEKDLEVEDSRPIWFNFSVPSGIVPGTYKTEVVLSNEDGKELDRKSASFTVNGSVKAPTKPAADSDTEDKETEK